MNDFSEMLIKIGNKAYNILHVKYVEMVTPSVENGHCNLMVKLTEGETKYIQIDETEIQGIYG